jgi:hypothetical protein
MYKRIGLYLGVGIYGLNILSHIINIVNGAFNLFLGLNLLVSLLVFYYLYIYLTREPEKGFFT